jgi:hypothetical protein
MMSRDNSSNADERRRWWIMVTDDLRRSAGPALMVLALSACGCLQAPTADGSPRARTLLGMRSFKSSAPDDGVALAVSKPSRTAGAGHSEAQPAEQGPDLNPVQLASSKDKEDSPPAEQAPPPRTANPEASGQTPPANGQTPPANGQAGKNPPAAPGNAPAAPGQRTGPGSYTPEPAFNLRKSGPSPTAYPPATAGLVPPGGIPVDPHQRVVPTASGALLNLPPGESPAERALELNARLVSVETERQALEVRARELTGALEARDRVLSQHSRDIHEAAEEVSKAREQVSTWRKELDEARVRLRSREMEDVQTLKAIVAVLERLTEASPGGPEGRHEGGPARMPEE